MNCSSPPGSRVPRPVSRGSPGTLAAYPFPAPPPPGFEQVVLPDFVSLLRSLSPVLVESSPGGSQAGTGPEVSSADPVSGVPLRHDPAQPADCPSGLRLNRPRLGPGWQAGPQVPTRRRLLEHHPAFAPLLGAFAPRLSSRSCPPSVPGGDTLPGCGTAVEDWDRPRDPWVPSFGLLPCAAASA
jgi:hypothetical protein